MSEFVAGFVPRHAAPAERLRAVMEPEPGFAAAAPRAPRHFAPKPAGTGPKHFSPADPDGDPTEGWNPLDPSLDEPVLDPLQAAREAGYAEGFAAATAALAQAEERDRAMLGSLVEALGQAGRIDRDAMAGRLRATVMLLVGRLVGEVGVSADLLSRRVVAATDLLAEKSESALLRVHPDDVQLLEGKLPDNVFAAGDANVDRGSFVLEAASTVVEDGPELWLEQLAQAIDRVPLPTGSPSC
ncbi:flagellar biosynthesis protein FliH [Sphingomonas lenta]|uniref:Flagellar biosynthesis protein FliH n=1 Tax=Sphingomonas lenta TaxID=1141887 RepID=A0A2A2SFC9_9SPHN|nr:flagellar biosynthesis protein FliH [Sphingomonas lenta]PAX07938.1 flagellar biosynthesis protein FliH [Sphingomonas lenta]